MNPRGIMYHENMAWELESKRKKSLLWKGESQQWKEGWGWRQAVPGRGEVDKVKNSVSWKVPPGRVKSQPNVVNLKGSAPIPSPAPVLLLFHHQFNKLLKNQEELSKPSTHLKSLTCVLHQPKPGHRATFAGAVWEKGYRRQKTNSSAGLVTMEVI